MIIAITSEEGHIDSVLDQRFGRCAFFALYDTESQNLQFVENPNKFSAEGAGPLAVQLIAGQGANAVFSGEFGGKAKPILDKAGIRCLTHPEACMSVRILIDGLPQLLEK